MTGKVKIVHSITMYRACTRVCFKFHLLARAKLRRMLKRVPLVDEALEDRLMSARIASTTRFLQAGVVAKADASDSESSSFKSESDGVSGDTLALMVTAFLGDLPLSYSIDMHSYAVTLPSIQ